MGEHQSHGLSVESDASSEPCPKSQNGKHDWFDPFADCGAGEGYYSETCRKCKKTRTV